MKIASKAIARRPPVILLFLLVLAVLAFAGVNRMVNRFHQQEEALARHLYERGMKAQSEGHAEAALGAFRAALSYSHDNSQYQLSLARALRDSGRTAEAETYLIRLWERTPQEGAVTWLWGGCLYVSASSTRPFSITTTQFTASGQAMPKQNGEMCNSN